MSRVLTVVSEVASFAALITALLYYFGWRRSQAQAQAFGTDVSVFEMSTPDYVLRSIDTVFLPGAILLLLGLLFVWLHRRLVASPHAARVGTVFQFSWLAALVMSVVTTASDQLLGMYLFPFYFALGFFGTWYGLTLRRAAAGTALMTSVPLMLLVGTIAAAALFLVTERVARVIGEAYADDIKLDVDSALHGVTVYSAERLQLAGDNVFETDFGDPQAAYRYRYDGLYLLQHSGDKYFLVTRDWSRERGRLVVLPDDEAIRVEFGPEGGTRRE